MNQQDTTNQSGIIETPHAQTLKAATVNDLPVNETLAAEVKGGVVTIEYLLLGTTLTPPPTATLATRP